MANINSKNGGQYSALGAKVQASETKEIFSGSLKQQTKWTLAQRSPYLFVLLYWLICAVSQTYSSVHHTGYWRWFHWLAVSGMMEGRIDGGLQYSEECLLHDVMCSTISFSHLCRCRRYVQWAEVACCFLLGNLAISLLAVLLVFTVIV